MGLNSRLYEIMVWHKRQTPKVYSFQHRVFMFYLDLDELDVLPHTFGLIGHNQPRLYNFREDDHIRLIPGTLKENVIAYAKSQGLTADIAKVFLLTNLRVLGYVFNPVSFFFCYDESRQPACVVVEIGNTFGELKYFYLGPEARHGSGFKDGQVKFYYISPFTNLDEVMDFNISFPDEKLRLTIDIQKDGQKYFYSTMTGKALPLHAGSLWRMTLLYPLVTLRVIILIHWHALVLAVFKKINFHAKEDRKDLQKGVYRSWRGTSQSLSPNP